MPTVSCASAVAPADMGGRDDVGVAEQRRRGGRRLFGKNVQRGAGDLARLERAGQRIDVDQLAPRTVDDPNTVFHLGEGVVVDKTLGFRRYSKVQGDVIAAREKFVERRQLNTAVVGRFARNKGVMGDHLHSERPRPHGHLHADVAQPDNAERFAVEFGAEELLLFPFPRLG